MTNVQTILLIGGIVALMFVFIAVLLPWAIRKGLPVGGLINATGATLSAADLIIESMKDLLPESVYVHLIDRIIEWGRRAAEAAEQLYKSQQLPRDQRKGKARTILMDMLIAAKVEITPEIEAIVDGAIEAGVMTLPPTGDVPEE